MPEDIKEYIKKRLSEKAKPEVIKYEVLSKGFLESDVDKIIKKQTGISTKSYIVEKFFTRELFFKLSSGFGNDQFIYIFLFLLTSSYFILGVTVGLSVILSLLFSMFLQDLFKKKKMFQDFEDFQHLEGLWSQAIALPGQLPRLPPSQCAAASSLVASRRLARRRAEVSHKQGKLPLGSVDGIPCGAEKDPTAKTPPTKH